MVVWNPHFEVKKKKTVFAYLIKLKVWTEIMIWLTFWHWTSRIHLQKAIFSTQKKQKTKKTHGLLLCYQTHPHSLTNV